MHIPVQSARALPEDILFIALACLVLRGPTFGFSEVNWDESAIALVAREILFGNWPFTAVFDHKPIGIYLHFAAAIVLIGDNPTATRLLGWLVVTASAVMIRQFAVRRLRLSRAEGLFLAASFLFASMGFGGAAVYTEHFVNLYVLASAYLLTGRNHATPIFFSGVAAGIAINVNYLALIVCAGMIAGYLFAPIAGTARRNLRFSKVPVWTLGVATATAVLLSPIFGLSDPSAYFAPQFSFLSSYRDTVDASAAAIRFISQASALLPLVATALGLAWLAFVARERAILEQREADQLTLAVFTGALVGAAAAAAVSGYAFDHYFLLLVPPLLLITAALLSSGIDPPARLMAAAAVGGTSAMLATPGLTVSALGAYDLVLKSTRGDLRMDGSREIANIARPKLSAGDTIYAVCTPLAPYQLLQVRPPTRFPFYPHHLNSRYANALGIDVDDEVARVFAKAPAVVVLGPGESCWGTPRASRAKVERALARHGYTPYRKLRGFRFYERPPLLRHSLQQPKAN